jgi:hypothetical protein
MMQLKLPCTLVGLAYVTAVGQECNGLLSATQHTTAAEISSKRRQ